MTKEDAQDVSDEIQQCGWEMLLFDDFRKIKDEKFHELRKNYLKSIEEMKKYLGESL